MARVEQRTEARELLHRHQIDRTFCTCFVLNNPAEDFSGITADSCGFTQPHARAATVLVDEFHAGRLKRVSEHGNRRASLQPYRQTALSALRRDFKIAPSGGILRQ